MKQVWWQHALSSGHAPNCAAQGLQLNRAQEGGIAMCCCRLLTQVAKIAAAVPAAAAAARNAEPWAQESRGTLACLASGPLPLGPPLCAAARALARAS